MYVGARDIRMPHTEIYEMLCIHSDRRCDLLRRLWSCFNRVFQDGFYELEGLEVEELCITTRFEREHTLSSRRHHDAFNAKLSHARPRPQAQPLAAFQECFSSLLRSEYSRCAHKWRLRMNHDSAPTDVACHFLQHGSYPLTACKSLFLMLNTLSTP